MTGPVGRQIAMSDIPPFNADNITFSGSAQVSTQAGYYWRGNVNGTLTNPLGVWANVFQADSFAVTAQSSTGNTRVYTNLGGAGHVGGFLNFDSTLFINQTTGNGAGHSKFYQAGNVNARAVVNDGGTVSVSAGSLNGNCVYATLGSGATYWTQVIGEEMDLAIETGASAKFIVGRSIVLLSTNAVAASVENAGFLVSAQGGATPTIDCAYAVGGYQGFNPIAPAGGILKYLGHGGASSGPTITYGIDLSLFTFTGNAFASVGFSVNGSGDVAGKTFTPNSKPTVTGSRGGNAALASLLTALAAIGLITDSTS